MIWTGNKTNFSNMICHVSDDVIISGDLWPSVLKIIVKSFDKLFELRRCRVCSPAQ